MRKVALALCLTVLGCSGSDPAAITSSTDSLDPGGPVAGAEPLLGATAGMNRWRCVGPSSCGGGGGISACPTNSLDVCAASANDARAATQAPYCEASADIYWQCSYPPSGAKGWRCTVPGTCFFGFGDFQQCRTEWAGVCAVSESDAKAALGSSTCEASSAYDHMCPVPPPPPPPPPNVYWLCYDMFCNGWGCFPGPSVDVCAASAGAASSASGKSTCHSWPGDCP